MGAKSQKPTPISSHQVNAGPGMGNLGPRCGIPVAVRVGVSLPLSLSESLISRAPSSGIAIASGCCCCNRLLLQQQTNCHRLVLLLLRALTWMDGRPSLAAGSPLDCVQSTQFVTLAPLVIWAHQSDLILNLGEKRIGLHLELEMN